MSKDLNIAFLLDFYGEMLTEKQRDVIELYYDEDLSLGEIAETAHITRQGVRDSIKRGEAQLLELEEKLGLAGKFRRYEEMLEEISGCAETIKKENTMYQYSRVIGESADRISALAKKSKEIF